MSWGFPPCPPGHPDGAQEAPPPPPSSMAPMLPIMPMNGMLPFPPAAFGPPQPMIMPPLFQNPSNFMFPPFPDFMMAPHQPQPPIEQFPPGVQRITAVATPSPSPSPPHTPEAEKEEIRLATEKSIADEKRRQHEMRVAQERADAEYQRARSEHQEAFARDAAELDRQLKEQREAAEKAKADAKDQKDRADKLKQEYKARAAVADQQIKELATQQAEREQAFQAWQAARYQEIVEESKKTAALEDEKRRRAEEASKKRTPQPTVKTTETGTFKRFHTSKHPTEKPPPAKKSSPDDDFQTAARLQDDLDLKEGIEASLAENYRKPHPPEHYVEHTTERVTTSHPKHSSRSRSPHPAHVRTSPPPNFHGYTPPGPSPRLESEWHQFRADELRAGKHDPATLFKPAPSGSVHADIPENSDDETVRKAPSAPPGMLELLAANDDFMMTGAGTRWRDRVARYEERKKKERAENEKRRAEQERWEREQEEREREDRERYEDPRHEERRHEGQRHEGHGHEGQLRRGGGAPREERRPQQEVVYVVRKKVEKERPRAKPRVRDDVHKAVMKRDEDERRWEQEAAERKRREREKRRERKRVQVTFVTPSDEAEERERATSSERETPEPRPRRPDSPRPQRRDSSQSEGGGGRSRSPYDSQGRERVVVIDEHGRRWDAYESRNGDITKYALHDPPRARAPQEPDDGRRRDQPRPILVRRKESQDDVPAPRTTHDAQYPAQWRAPGPYDPVRDMFAPPGHDERREESSRGRRVARPADDGWVTKHERYYRHKRDESR